MILKEMLKAFQILNNEGNLVEDQFGNDVFIKEDGSSKFKSITAGSIIATTLTGSLTTAAQTNITSLGTLTALNVDNINLNANTISTTNTNGTLILAPNGTGVVQLSKALDANSNAISNVTTLGATTVNATNIAGTLTTAAQPNITSLGALTSLQVSNILLNSNVITNLTAIDVGTVNATTVNATTLAGTLSTAAQTNVTSLGILTELVVDNINIDANSISATNTNGSIILTPKGTGVVQITKPLDANLQNITNVATIGPCYEVSLNGVITSIGNTNITITPGGTGTIRAGKALNMQTFDITNAGTVTATNLAGTLTTAAQPNITSIGGLGILYVDNIVIDGNTIAATNTNGNLNLNPNGTGSVVIPKISSGLLAVDNIEVNGNSITVTNINGNLNINPNGTGSTIITGPIQVGGTVTSTNQIILSTSNVLGVRIDNLKLPWCQISTPSGVTYFTQNSNLSGMSIVTTGIYVGMFSLTSGTTFSVGEDMSVMMTMTATFSDSADERIAGIELYNNGVFVDSSASAIPYLESGVSFADVCFSKHVALVAGRSYTWRFSSVATGTADLRAFNAFILRVS